MNPRWLVLTVLVLAVLALPVVGLLAGELVVVVLTELLDCAATL
jgi:hypothetical protein